MKTSTVILALSLAANAALLAALAWRNVDGPATSAESSASASVAHRVAGEATRAGKEFATGPNVAGTWTRLRTDDLPMLVARLRAAGFPPDVVLGMIRALAAERFDARRLEFANAEFAVPFWKRSSRPARDAQKSSEWSKLLLEQDAFVHALIGPGYADLIYAPNDGDAWRQRRFGNPAPEKIDRLYRAQIEYEDQRSQLRGQGWGGGRYAPLQSDHAKQVELEQAYRAGLAQFLSPAEVSEVMMRGGMASRDIGYLLAPMKLSEEQYRAVYPLYQAFQDQNPAFELLSYRSAKASPADRLAVEQLNAQIAAVLGPDRAADLQQITNMENNQINAFVLKAGLPVSAAIQVTAVQQDIQQRVAAIQSDATLDAAIRQARVTALAQEASEKISTVLGSPSAFAAYELSFASSWMRKLGPKQ